MDMQLSPKHAPDSKPPSGAEPTDVTTSPVRSADETRVTPMMEQYTEIKAGYPDCLLFYRMGDFYELFFADAETASRDLGIVLTKRGKHLGRDIPMCGVPIERADEYLHRLIALGHRVAVCEQLEDPAEARRRGGKSVVRRNVVRLVTPGTLTEDSLLDARRSNYLAAVARARTSATQEVSRFAVAFLDISTGEFRATECDRIGLSAQIARIEPGEMIVPDALYDDPDHAAFWRSRPGVTPLTRDVFDGATAERRLAAYFEVASTEAFGSFSRLELTAAAACVTYLERTQLGRRPLLSPPTREAPGVTLAIDAATRANLELIRTLSGERRGSLLAAIDRTVTPAGARLLSERLAAPLTDVGAIAARLDAVELLLRDPGLRSDVRARLGAAPDLARALARLVVGRGGPRDLAAIRDGVEAATQTAVRLAGLGALPAEIADIRSALEGAGGALAARISAALAEELPAFKRDGGFVRAGFDPTLDEVRTLRDEARRVVAGLQARYAEATGIRSLKIRHNNVLGYFVEVSTQHGEKLLAPPHNADYIHRQTLAGQTRFSTTELSDLEAKIANAGERAIAIELEIFDRLCAMVADASGSLRAAAQALAALDVSAALAALASDEDYTRPEVDSTLDFIIEGGRHPVVEQALRREGGPFVANDCDLSPPPKASAGRIWVVTGPNMAGKSTFLRQNALITVLAQAGSFVPARRARIGIVDRLFSRVGAADDLARGRSTFMVEMVETAAILNQAGRRSLVILDEIGRGTATFDGLSIAWATIEHLHETNGCRALFATHFHELTALAASLPRLSNATVRVKEWQGEVVFLHELVPGAADRSYGIQVAKLAGLPSAVIERSKLILARLEAEDRSSPARNLVDDLPLFAATRRTARTTADAGDPIGEAVTVKLAALDPDDMTPRDALEALYALKLLLAGKADA
jgi:DNA mismatch repair protein MutS